MTENLLPCPFCGGEADIFEASEDSFCALCTGCGVETPYQISTEEAVAAWNRRAAYEDAEEQGRCVVLPCKVGDTVYFIREEYTGNNSIQSNEVFEIKLDSRGVVFYGVPRRCSMDFMCYIEDLGKTVFLTRAEAEEALKGVQRE